MRAFWLCQRDLAVKSKSDLDGVQSFDSILVELSTSGVGKVLFCKLNSTYLSKNWVMENTLGEGWW